MSKRVLCSFEIVFCLILCCVDVLFSSVEISTRWHYSVGSTLSFHANSDLAVWAYFLAFLEVHVNSFIFLSTALYSETRLFISLVPVSALTQSYPTFALCRVENDHATGEYFLSTKLVYELRNRRMAREHVHYLFFYIAVHSGLSLLCSISPWLVSFGTLCRF